MNEFLVDVRHELKKLEHVVFVSLKFTRTRDVLMSALKKTVDVYEKIINSLLHWMLSKEMIDEIPMDTRSKKRLLEEHFPHKDIKNYLKFYGFLKKVIRAEYKVVDEHRRYITLVFDLDNGCTELDIDTLEDCYTNITKQFYDFVTNVIAEEA